MTSYNAIYSEFAAQHYDPYKDAKRWPVSAVITLGRLHAEADAATGADFPITGEELAALAKQAQQNPRDAILTALAIGKARHEQF